MEVYLAPSCHLYSTSDGKYSCQLWDRNRTLIYPAEERDLALGHVNRVAERALLTAVLADMRSFYFIGDSLSGQHFRAFACLAMVSMRVPTTLSPPSGDQAYPHADCFYRTGTSDVLNGSETSSICHVSAGHTNAAGTSRWRSSAAMLDTLAARWLRRGDVVILNEGAHHRSAMVDDDKALASELDRVRELNRSLLHELSGRGVHLFWRSTFAQHFDTPTGGWTERVSHRPSPAQHSTDGRLCHPLNASSLGGASLRRADALSRDVIASASEGSGMEPLDGFAHSIDLWRAHCEMSTPYARRRAHVHGFGNGYDCTHWCEPSLLFAALNRELVHRLARGRR